MKSLQFLYILAFVVLISACVQKNSESFTDKIRVGVFSGEGASVVCVIETIEALKIDEKIFPAEISPKDIMEGKLNELDALIFPEPDIRDGYYDRGRGLIAFQLNKQGKEIFPELENHDTLYVQYYDGPIFKFSESSSSNILGSFYSNVANHPGYPHGTTPGNIKKNPAFPEENSSPCQVKNTISGGKQAASIFLPANIYFQQPREFLFL